MKKLPFIAFILMAAIILASCKDDNNYEKLRQNEVSLLNDFVKRYEAAHGVTLNPGTSGLYYIEIEKGAGDTIVLGDKVQLWYNTYRLKDTVMVDSNMEGGKYDPLEFVVAAEDYSTVVEGLNEAVKNMQLGTKAFLIVPSELGYGQTGSGSVPAFSTLLFDIEIYKVFRASEGY